VQWGYATPEVLAAFAPTLTFANPADIAQALAARREPAAGR
jgi:hypothetical protein